MGYGVSQGEAASLWRKPGVLVVSYPVPTATSASKGSKRMWVRPLVAVSCKGIWGAPQPAKHVIPEVERLPMVGG